MPGTVLGIEDTKTVCVFTLLRRVDMKKLQQYQMVAYIQEGMDEWSEQVS